MVTSVGREDSRGARGALKGRAGVDLEVGPVSRWGKGDPRGSIPPPGRAPSIAFEQPSSCSRISSRNQMSFGPDRL